MAEDQEEKTEQATDAKREEFRKRGQVAMTRELSTALFFLATAAVLYAASRFFLQNIVDIFNRSMGGELVYTIREGKLTEVLAYVGFKLVILLAPMFLLSIVIGVGAQLMQTGFLQVEDALQPNLNKLNPLNSLGRIFSMKGLAELLKSITKMAVIGFIVYLTLKS